MHNVNAVRTYVTLSRNYPDIPFDVTGNGEDAPRVIRRTAGALEDSGCSLHLLRDMQQENCLALQEDGRIPPWIKVARETSAVMLPPEGAAALVLAATAHVTITSQRAGMDPAGEALADCLHYDDLLSGHVTFAFDEALGYLQGQYPMMGTGLCVCQRLHLPLLLGSDRMPELRAQAAKEGVRLVNGAQTGCKAAGGLVDVINTSAMGRSEEEIRQLVQAQAQKLCLMETELREKALQENPVALEDRAWRAYGLLLHARLLTPEEFWNAWSEARLGAEVPDLLPVTLRQLDALVPEAMPAHLRSYAQEMAEDDQLRAWRPIRVRELLEENPLM